MRVRQNTHLDGAPRRRQDTVSGRRSNYYCNIINSKSTRLGFPLSELICITRKFFNIAVNIVPDRRDAGDTGSLSRPHSQYIIICRELFRGGTKVPEYFSNSFAENAKKEKKKRNK